MTDPVPVLRREVDVLNQTRLMTLNALCKATDLSKPLAGEPLQKRSIAYPYPSV